MKKKIYHQHVVRINAVARRKVWRMLEMCNFCTFPHRKNYAD